MTAPTSRLPLLITCVLVSVHSFAVCQGPPAQGDDASPHSGQLSGADSSITLVPPRLISDLPEALRSKLEACGCLIPQVYAGNRLNAVTGRFERAEQLDWAVLCSRRGVSRIYVFWGGSPNHPSRLAARPDQPTPDERGRTCYPRLIGVGDAERVRINHSPAKLGFPDPTYDVLVDNVSSDEYVTLYYRHKGRWVKFRPR